jgi:putative OPT family oligopeptide transporter
MAKQSKSDMDRQARNEITLRGLALGGVLTFLFTAANTYLGLKVGLTFASAIPAAVISMALLRSFRTSTIWENMTVQTVASAAGAVATMIFVLPTFVMVGWWTDFPFWQSFLICALGGVLGVTFSIPLRRALVINANLAYPEGVAAAEVLKVGSRGAHQTMEAVRENAAGLVTVVVGSIASALFASLAAAKVFVGEAAAFLRLPASMGGGATGGGGSLSLALLGAGHLVGLTGGIAMLVGLTIAWGVAVPILSAGTDLAGSAEEIATKIWRSEVRFIGVGAIGAAAIWTIIKLIGPLASGISSALSAQRKRAAREEIDRVEQDIPIVLVGFISLATLAAIGVLLWAFVQGTPLANFAPALVAGGVLYVVVIGAIVSAVCGYMAGLLGSSSSPVSSVGILSVVFAALMMLAAMQTLGVPADPAIVAYALLVTAVVFGIAVVANDNLQDMKTAQLVDATPWRQQVALILGVVAGAIVVPPVLDLLNGAYGFVGGPAPTVAGAQPLPAPQATLISTLAKGVIGGELRWDLIGMGAVLGVVVILMDEALNGASDGKLRLPPLAVGIGVYLTMPTTVTVVLGAVLGTLYNGWVSGSKYEAVAKRLGVLLASGLIVGESLFGVMLAGVIVLTQNGEPFALVPQGTAWPAFEAGLITFGVSVLALYIWTRNKASRV